MLITLDELARGAAIGIFGGLAGVCTLAYPGSLIWMLPAGFAVIGCAATAPEIRREIRLLTPQLADQTRGLLPARRAHESATPASASPAHQPAQQTRDPLFGALGDAPHLLIIGYTGGGKTTLLHSLAMDWAASKQRVVVFDPDAAPGQWPGCNVAGGGDDYERIAQGVTLINKEVARRRAARADGQRAFPPVHVIIDEAHDVVAEVPDALPLIESLARRGRKLNMHLALGVQDKQVGTLKLEGKGQLLRNFQVADVMLRGDQRVARLHQSDGLVDLPIPRLIDPEAFILPRQTPAAPATTRAAPDDLLKQLLGVSSVPHTSVSNPGVSTALPRARHGCVSVSVSSAQDTDTDTDTAVDAGLDTDPPTVRIEVRATAESNPIDRLTPLTPRRRRPGRAARVNIARMKQRAEDARAKNALRAAYAERKAAGLSYRKAYAQLGGGSAETREWWKATPAPMRNAHE